MTSATALTTLLTIDARCTACGLCLSTCPEGALKKAPKRPAVVQERCTACMACIEVCPVDAIALKESGR
jgi:ferredoxin